MDSFEQLYGQVVKERLYPLVRTWIPKRQRYEWVESEPDACPACGASWGRPGTMQRGYRPCGTHHGHRTWLCGTCSGETVNATADSGCR